MLVRFGLIFVVLFLVVTVNLPASIIAQMGFEPDALMGALVAFVVTGLIAHQRMMFILLVIALAIGANLPEEVAASYGVDRIVLLATLAAVVLVPQIRHWFE